MGGEVTKNQGGGGKLVYKLRRKLSCSHCYSECVFLCDFVMNDGKTCDQRLCRTHAATVGLNKHYCPVHTAISQGVAQEAPDAREKRQWWAVTEDRDVRHVTGYSCAPKTPDAWWCPELGFSGMEGHHLFSTRDEAFAKVISELEHSMEVLQKHLEDLKRRR